MRLKLCATASFKRRLQNFCVNRGVGRDETQHRRVQSAVRQRRRPRAGRAHAGLDHARAFADAADANRFSAELEFHRNLFRLGVARHDRFRRVVGVFSG